MPAWIRIVIVDYKSGAHLQTCVDALLAQTFTDFEVVIVDNTCPEGAARKLVNLDARFHILEAGENLGYAGGCNFGVDGNKTQNAHPCKTPWVAMLNPDAFPQPDWLHHLHQAAQTYPDISIFSTTLVSADNPDILDGFGDVLSVYGIAWHGGGGAPLSSAGQEDVYVFGPCGAAALYRTDVFRQAGGFDTDFFCYIEDVDLAWRLQQQGKKCVQVRRALCAHVGSVSTATNPEFRYYHAARNTIWMIVKCTPLWLLPIMLGLNMFSHLYLYRSRAQRGEASAWSRGLRHGLYGLPRFWKKRKPLARQRKIHKHKTLNGLVIARKSVQTRAIHSWPIPPANNTPTP
ncbi:MAG: hypothetical protein COA69_11100 [Robiginitomaculum sp.]|nr:MAG: hypothetical protein COA69_11100 [Robiginitomaculum sp.]